MKKKMILSRKKDQLEAKGVNTLRLFKNALFLIVFVVLFILVISSIVQQTLFFNDHIKDSEPCQVKLISKLGYVRYGSDFPDWNEAQVIDTGEELNTTFSFRNMDRKVMQRFYPVQSQLDAHYFYYEDSKLVHLKNAMLFIVLDEISVSLMFLLIILTIIFTALYRIKNVHKKDAIWLTKKRSRWIRFISLAVSYALIWLSFYNKEDIFWLSSFAPYISFVYTIPFVAFFMTHHDYYADPPKPIEDTE